MELTREGKTEKQIAEIIGVHETTIYHWKKMDLEFSMALKEAKQEADQIVEAALFKRATGYETEEERINDKGEITTVKKIYPPDATSMIFWLKNRQPKQWRERVEIDQTIRETQEIKSKDGTSKAKFNL